MVSVNSFYGNTSIAQLKIEKILKNQTYQSKKPLPLFLNSLLGPSRTWKVFRKQEDAIQLAVERQSNGIMAFAFEHCAGERSFLVCHPEVLWYVNSNRPSNKQCSYEIIPEGKPSKLYLDLEFDYSSNPYNDFKKGEDMVKILIDVLTIFLKNDLNIEVNENHFLDLDSSSDAKFSRHLILNIPNQVFSNNFVVGNIVKSVCFKIQKFVSTKKSEECIFGVTVDKLNDLFITDRKGVKKIFVDLTVYSRNRHFRLLGSTKLFKNSHLKVSLINKFKPKDDEPHSMFISSLITHFDIKSTLVNFRSTLSTLPTTTIVRGKTCGIPFGTDPLDKYILEKIAPLGGIRQKFQIQQRKLKYDISGFRYCNNIGREHRSNNIFYVVDLEKLLLYQHCYDPDCKEFVSNGTAVPSSVIFSSADDSILIEAVDYTLNDDELLKLMDCDEGIFSENPDNIKEQPVQKMIEIPDMNLTDSELMDIVNISEDVL